MAVDKRKTGKVARLRNAGANHAGYFAVDDPLATTTGEPVDMAQVRADDALIDALANPDRRTEADPLDEQLAALLQTWRSDVDTDTLRPLIDVETAAAAIKAGPRPARRHNPFGPLAAAAAVLAIVFTGVGLAARDAEPGDPLWNVTKVLYSEKAKSVEAAVTVRSKLEVATNALASGEVAEAQEALEQAQEKLPVVAAEDGQQDLLARTEQLIQQLEQLAPAPPTSSMTTTSEPTVTTTDPPGTTTPPDPTTTTDPDPVTTTAPELPTPTSDPNPGSSETPGDGSPAEKSPTGSDPGSEPAPGSGGEPEQVVPSSTATTTT